MMTIFSYFAKTRQFNLSLWKKRNGNSLEAVFITLLNSITFHGGHSRLVRATGSIRIAPPPR